MILYLTLLLLIIPCSTPLSQFLSLKWLIDLNPNTGITITNNMLKPDIETVKRGVFYASVARCATDKLREWSCKNCLAVPETTFISGFSNTLIGTKGYVAIDNASKSINLAFRGTNNTINDIEDLALIQAQYNVIPTYGALVHEGFLIAMSSLESKFLFTLKELLATPAYQDYKIYVIGHSLGGAMASLALLKIQSELKLDWNRFTLLTYGQPRTGNRKFAQYYNSLNIPAARVVNFDDLIPHLPQSSVLTYTHHGNELWIPKTGTSDAKYCNNRVYEDPNCSNSVPFDQQSYPSHLIYFDVQMEDQYVC